MNYAYFLFIVAIIFLIAAQFYHRFSFLHTKKIAYISLMQHILLIAIPGVIFSIIFSVILDIIQRPPNRFIFINDRIVAVLLLLSLLFSYAGLAIHTSSKTLSACFKEEKANSFAFKVNKFFHLKFSHNINFAGAISAVVFLSLLEINHLPTDNNHSLWLPIINGAILAAALVIGITNYRTVRKPWSEYLEVIPWSDLQFFFYSFWVVFAVFAYAAKPYLKTINHYPITLTMFTACLLIALLSVFLYSRRVVRKTKVRINNRQSTHSLNG